jgi:hypothetical protein
MRPRIRSHRTHLMATSAFFLVLAALVPTSALAKAGGTDRPISAGGPGSTTANLATGTFVFEFSGTGSHLGKFTATTEGTIVPTGPGTFALSGNAILVAANGDQLTATATATVTVNGPVSGVATITGGTGRFEDASGTLTLEDAQEKLVSFDGVTAVFTGEPTVTGRISY